MLRTPMIATCAVDRIPPAWIEQLAPGGRILEVNPNGQLAFIEDATGLPITASIADALQPLILQVVLRQVLEPTRRLGSVFERP